MHMCCMNSMIEHISIYAIKTHTKAYAGMMLQTLLAMPCIMLRVT